MQFALGRGHAVNFGFQEGTKHGGSDIKRGNEAIIEPEAESWLTGQRVNQGSKNRKAPSPATRPLAKQALNR